MLTRDGEPDHERITQIGSEGGLLQAPVSIPGQGLVLASAERAEARLAGGLLHAVGAAPFRVDMATTESAV